jgi:dolichyl-phosphate-mannose--protein O-mannosyl transferase
VLYILAKLGERMGEAMQIKPYFYLYYAGILIFVLALGYTLIFRTADAGLTHMVANLLLAIGMTFGLVATVKYWGWLIKELL